MKNDSQCFNDLMYEQPIVGDPRYFPLEFEF